VKPNLDAWLEGPAVRTHHRREAEASPDALWAAAQEIRLADTGTLGRLVRWRIPGTPQGMTYHEMFRTYPFTLLEESEHSSISGLCGRIWTLQRDYPRLEGADAFRDWEKRGTVRVAIANWVEPTETGSALVSEARVKPVDRVAGVRLKAVWSVVGRFQRFGAEPLTLAVKRAQEGS